MAHCIYKNNHFWHFDADASQLKEIKIEYNEKFPSYESLYTVYLGLRYFSETLQSPQSIKLTPISIKAV